MTGPDNNLYARILGAAWHQLAEPVRSLHHPGVERRGGFRIARGEGRIAGILAKWSRLPRAAANAKTQLRIEEQGDRQRWERSFDGEPLVTTQWAGESGCLVERIGSWELCFRLRVGDGALFYEQLRARFRLGPLRLPLPCSPRVAASEWPDGSERVRVSVEVRLPLLGRLIAYDGWLSMEAPAS